MTDAVKLKERIIKAGYAAVEQLIKVAEEEVLKGGTRKSSDGEEGEEYYELSADRLKNAAAAKRIAIFDAFEILAKVEAERESLELIKQGKTIEESNQGFAERKSNKKR